MPEDHVGSWDNKVYALRPDGSLKWSFATGLCVSPSIGADGTLYLGSTEHRLYALWPDGSVKWSFATDGYVCSSPAIGEDGTVYAGSDDFKLYAFGRGDPKHRQGGH